MTVDKLLDLNWNYWLLQTLAMMLTALLIPNLKVTGPLGALMAVVGLAFMNSKLWDTALFFRVPDTLSTRALALFFANGILFWILVKILPGISVKGILPALIAPVVFTLCSLFISEYGQDIDWAAVFTFVFELVSDAKDHFLGGQSDLQSPGNTDAPSTSVAQ